MTLQHIFYIPTIFLLGFIFGTMFNQKSINQENIKYRTSKINLLQTFLIFILIFIVTHIFEIPWGPKMVKKLLGGIELFDRKPLFTSIEIYNQIHLFSKEGIYAYKHFTYTIDILFPLSFFLFLLTYARFITQRILISKKTATVLLSFPFIWFSFDLIENTIIFNILTNYPIQNIFLGNTLGKITILKFILLTLSIFTPSIFFTFTKKELK